MGDVADILQPDAEAIRRVPVELLRRWCQDRVELSSVRDVATRAGVGRNTLSQFVLGETIPHPRVQRLLAIHMVAETGLSPAQLADYEKDIPMPQASDQHLPFPDLDIAVVRRFVQTRANATSVRAVAAAIGMRHTSLEKFLDGSEPYARNRSLICAWYVRQDPQDRLDAQSEAQGTPRGEHANDLSYHLEVLLGELTGPARGETLMRITRALSDGYVRMTGSAPAWLVKRR